MNPGPASPGPLWEMIFPVTDGAACPIVVLGKPLGISGLLLLYVTSGETRLLWKQEIGTWCVCATEMTGLTRTNE